MNFYLVAGSGQRSPLLKIFRSLYRSKIAVERKAYSFLLRRIRRAPIRMPAKFLNALARRGIESRARFMEIREFENSGILGNSLKYGFDVKKHVSAVRDEDFPQLVELLAGAKIEFQVIEGSPNDYCVKRVVTQHNFVDIVSAVRTNYEVACEGLAIPLNVEDFTSLNLPYIDVLRKDCNQYILVARIFRIIVSKNLGISNLFTPQATIFDLRSLESRDLLSPAPPPRCGCIDAVITWVDGGDLSWRLRRDEWIAREHAAREADSSNCTLDHCNATPDAFGSERFTNRGELLLLVRALDRFAPWLRRIFVVTDGQVPVWFKPNVQSRVRFVPHEDILEPSQLPTFNSHAIEASLHRIEGLAPRFIYFNDDMLPVGRLTKDMFFDSNLRPRVFLSSSGGNLSHRSLLLAGESEAISHLDSLVGSDWGAVNAARILSMRFGLHLPQKLQHAPYASSLAVIEEANRFAADELSRTRSSRFRSRSDVATFSNLYPQWGLASGDATSGTIAYVYARGEETDFAQQLYKASTSRSLRVLCVNSLSDSQTSLLSDFGHSLGLLQSASE